MMNIPCHGLYIKLKEGCHFQPVCWEECMVNTVYVDEVEHLLCMPEDNSGKYLLIKLETRQCKIKLRILNNMVLKKIKVTYIPMNCNILTTYARSTRICDTVKFLHTVIPFPNVTLTDHLRQAASDLITILTAPPLTNVPSLAAGDPTRNAWQHN